MLKALVFDFDGLIIDTETPWYEAFVDVYGEYGAVLPLALYVKCVGTDSKAFHPRKYLEQCIGGPVDAGAFQEQTLARHAARMKERTINPGVLELLQAAQKAGLKIGLASSSERAWVVGFLEQLNLLPYFDTIRTREDVSAVKPAPDLYLRVLADFGVTGAEAVAFEDSPNGTRAAKAAGLFCVIVPQGVTKDLVFEGHDLRVASLAEVSPARLRQEFGG